MAVKLLIFDPVFRGLAQIHEYIHLLIYKELFSKLSRWVHQIKDNFNSSSGSSIIRLFRYLYIVYHLLFKNKLTIFLYNNKFSQIICVYNLKNFRHFHNINWILSQKVGYTQSQATRKR